MVNHRLGISLWQWIWRRWRILCQGKWRRLWLRMRQKIPVLIFTIRYYCPAFVSKTICKYMVYYWDLVKVSKQVSLFGEVSWTFACRGCYFIKISIVVSSFISLKYSYKMCYNEAKVNLRSFWRFSFSGLSNVFCTASAFLITWSRYDSKSSMWIFFWQFLQSFRYWRVAYTHGVFLVTRFFLSLVFSFFGKWLWVRIF